MHVVCTAGHVDHGKSTLVRALTGMEPDRFAEERERGLTIDLGFAWSELRAGDHAATVAFVDLPGHERFVGNMLAGAGPVTLALFVVAADEGWMPQSQEHLDILDLLGVRHGLVALTKADAVDEDTLAVGADLVRERLAGSSFAAVDIVPVSAATGAGLDVLTGRLLAALRAAPAARDDGRPRLWVDRSFSIRGAGTVVTGTLGGGSLRVGEELTVLPGRRGGRVRGLQSLKSAVDEAAPGSRVAVNLSGVDRDQVTRGDALGVAGQWRSVRVFDAHVRALGGYVVGRRGAWHLHVGSGRRLADLYPLDGQPELSAGMVRVELDRAVAVTAGDRFVLREAGRRATIGGGIVLDPDPPPRPQGTDERAARLTDLDQRHQAIAAGDRAALLALHVRERGAANATASAAAVGLSHGTAQAAAKAHGLLPLGGAAEGGTAGGATTMWAHPEAVGRWAAAVTAALGSYHGEHPLERAAPKDVAQRALSAAGCPETAVDPLLGVLAALGRLVAEGPGLRTPTHAVALDPAQAAARRRLLETLDADPFRPPNLAEAATAANAPPALIRELEAAGDLIRIAPDLALTATALDQAAAALRAAYRAEGPLTAARAKEVLDTTRKYAVPLLEELDRRGVTRRTGDTREVR